MAKMLKSSRNPAPRPVRTVGLGDVIEVVARPIARILGIQNCTACKERQARANAVRIPVGRQRP